MFFQRWCRKYSQTANFSKLRSENDINLHVKEVERRGNKINIEDEENKLSDHDTQKNEIIEDLKNVEYNHPENLIFRMALRYSEVGKILDTKYISTSSIGFTLPPGIYEISDIDLTLTPSLPKVVKVNIIIDDNRLRSNLTTNKTKKFTRKSFFYTIMGFTQSHSGP